MGQDEDHESAYSIVERIVQEYHEFVVERIQQEVYGFVFAACWTTRDWMPPKPKRSLSAHALVQTYRDTPKFESYDDENEFTEEIINAAFHLASSRRSGRGYAKRFNRSAPIRYWLERDAWADLWGRSISDAFLTWRYEVSEQYINRRLVKLRTRSTRLLAGALERPREDVDTDLDMELDRALNFLNLEEISLMEASLPEDGVAWIAFIDEHVDLLREWLQCRGLPHRSDDVYAIASHIDFGPMDDITRYKVRTFTHLFEFD